MMNWETPKPAVQLLQRKKQQCLELLIFLCILGLAEIKFQQMILVENFEQ